MKSIFLFIPIFLLITCQKNEIKPIISPCMQELISSYQQSDLPCPEGKSIYRYFFQGEYVYVFLPGDCGADMMSTIYDNDCNAICGLGGIAGNITCDGENFDDNASDETLIWKQ